MWKPKPDPNEERIRIIYLPEHEVLMAFDRMRRNGHALVLPVLGNIPEDARLERVFHDLPAGAFAFVVSHESFDRVPPGFVPARHRGELTFEVVKVTRLESGKLVK